MRTSAQRSLRGLAFCCLALLAGCAKTQSPVTAATDSPPPAATLSPMTVDDLVARELALDDALLIGAGDIADCGPQLQHAKDTAAIIQRFPAATVFAAGDDAYGNGTKEEFETCYEDSWGGFKARTRPSPGNHDYGIYPPVLRHNADPYFDYFGTSAGPRGLGYYSYDLGGWHVVSLNSMADERGAPAMAAQVSWLQQDLDRTEKRCILAYWHHPLFSSGDRHGDDPRDPGRRTNRLWDILLQHKADVIINGHDHHYERFAPQDSAHVFTKQGIREFIVGTGGGEDRGIGTPKDNSEIRLPNRYGVLLMTLHPSGYEWHFINVNGSVDDRSSGVDECH